jgi:hypothetical protein
MSYNKDYEGAAINQAANDSQVQRYIQQGQTEKARQRVWQIVQQFAQFLSNITSVVNTVLRWLGIVK